MSGMRLGCSPMKTGSGSSSTVSGSKGKPLRLVNCPRCGVRVITIRSKKAESYDELFFKCPNNIKDDSRTCRFFRSEAQYEMYLQALEAEKDRFEAQDDGHCIGGEKAELRQQYSELKQEVGTLKQQVDMALVEIWNLKMQICDLKQENKGFVLNKAIAIAVCTGLVIGVLVTKMLK
ncbi:unnamed protein product [Urochloa humidicola]